MTKKTVIYSVHCNRPDFVNMQRDSFAHWMRSPYELVIVNNADDPGMRTAIDRQALGNRIFNTKSHRDIPGFKHADSLNQTWQHIVKNHQDDYVMIVDGDAFLCGDFHTENYLEGAAMAGCKQQREYLWHWLSPVVMVFDMSKIPEAETIDWEGGAAPNGCRMDVGGNLFYYFEKHPEVKANTKWMHHTWHIKSENNNRHVLPDNVTHYQDEWNLEIFGDVFLHYCRSSNWDGQTPEHHRVKTDFVTGFVYGTFSGSIVMKRLNYTIPNDTYFGWGKWV